MPGMTIIPSLRIDWEMDGVKSGLLTVECRDILTGSPRLSEWLMDYFRGAEYASFRDPRRVLRRTPSHKVNCSQTQTWKLVRC